uniref:Uncharacterized protein n=1 Tax=Zea mays TaxID=4577 RepID=C4J2Y5_MAIZE|nr:unknown [Zea mays]
MTRRFPVWRGCPALKIVTLIRKGTKPFCLLQKRQVYYAALI